MGSLSEFLFERASHYVSVSRHRPVRAAITPCMLALCSGSVKASSLRSDAA
jgi:hypothetical protein